MSHRRFAPRARLESRAVIPAPKRLACVALSVAVVAVAGCGGDDGGGGSGGGAASIESCLEDAGLDVRDADVNALDAELVAAGAIHQFVAIDVDQQDYTYEIAVFSAPEKAAAYAKKQQREYDKQPSLKFQTEALGPNVATASTDSPKRDAVRACAEESG
jgi:hypothetical protein